MKFSVTILAMTMLALPALANDGTVLVGTDWPQDPSTGGDFWRSAEDVYVIEPHESVSISDDSVWQDNRHRAYYSPPMHVNGFLLFDLTEIPDGSEIISMTLRCYLEDAFGSPANNPVVDIYYSEDDGWTRNTAGPGSLSLDVLVVDDVPFNVWTEYHDFELDVSAHDWSIDLADNELCIGFFNDVPHYSYVYFFGAYGDPQGPPPELTIVTGITPTEESSWSQVKALY